MTQNNKLQNRIFYKLCNDMHGTGEITKQNTCCMHIKTVIKITLIRNTCLHIVPILQLVDYATIE